MSRYKNAVILFGLCSTVAACDRSPTEPEALTSQASDSATQSMSLLAAEPILRSAKAQTFRASLRLPSHHPLMAQTAATPAPTNATAAAPIEAPSRALLTWAVIASDAR